MRCVLLASPGEILEGQQELKELGYEAEAYPSTQQTDLLTDTVDKELSPFFLRTIESYDSPYVRSLRSSYSRMITDPKFQGDDFIIFGESDCTPVTSADEIRKAVKKAMAEHPDVDVFRLFNRASRNKVASPAKNEDIFSFEHFNIGKFTRGTSYVWGTHAIVIPTGSREKVAHIFTSYRLPIDNALEAAHSRGELKIMVTRDTHFYQKKRTCLFDKTQSYSYRNRKIAVCLTAKGNPQDLQRQIYSLMDQSYPDFHLFVAVKGIPTCLFHSMIEPSFRKYVESGKLTLRCFPEKTELSDFLDTVREEDLSAYELFVRIEENTFYAPGYLRNVNLFHCDIPQHRSSFYEGTAYSYDPAAPSLEENKKQIVKASFVFTPKILKQLQAEEDNPTLFTAQLPPSQGQGSLDKHLLSLMKKEGCSNIAEFVKNNKLQPFLVTARTPHEEARQATA